VASKTKQKAKDQNNLALKNFEAGVEMVKRHPIFAPLLQHASLYQDQEKGTRLGWGHIDESRFPKEGLARVSCSGAIFCRSKQRAEPEIWARALAHCLLHLGMGHFVEKTEPLLWNTACDLVVEKFLADLKFGRSRAENPLPAGINDEARLYLRFCAQGVDAEYRGFDTADGAGAAPDMIPGSSGENSGKWSASFAIGLNNAVRSAVNVVAGYQDDLSDEHQSHTKAARAKAWFISSYPLLGAIAANFKLIEDAQICQRWEIGVAAVSCGLQEMAATRISMRWQICVSSTSLKVAAMAPKSG
jgi:hypothetical protein